MRELGVSTGAKIPTRVFQTSAELAVHAAEEAASLIRENSAVGRWTNLALAAGLATLQFCRELVRISLTGGISLQRVRIFSVHEYYPIDPANELSYAAFFRIHLLSQGTDFEPSNFIALNGIVPDRQLYDETDGFERRIREFGGIDLLVIGAAGNGRLGFNSAETPTESRTGLRELCLSTRHEAASDFVGLNNSPTHGLSMGLATLMEAKRILLIATTEGRASIVKRILEGDVTDMIPASQLQTHENAVVLLDEAAASELCSVRTPWTQSEPFEWNWRLIARRLFDESLRSKAPLLSLRNEQLGDSLESLARQGFPATAEKLGQTLLARLNERVVTSFSKGYKTVLVFSPHPDDAEIQLGGTILKLRQQGVRVIVAVMTSGNVAVWDANTKPIVGDVNALQEFLRVSEAEARRLRPLLLTEAGRTSRPVGTVDSAELRQVKTVIRQNESVNGLAKLQVPLDDVVFLRLPFYETGGVEKRPPTEADFAIVMKLLNRYQPSQIFAAGDLSDPHGTHRVCLDIILESARRIADEPWIADTDLLLYRGAWAEWSPEDMDLIVPLTSAELREAVDAMRCHKSQIPNALFPGCDDRPFDLRAEQRKVAAGKMFTSFGLGPFDAIEGFRRAALV